MYIHVCEVSRLYLHSVFVHMYVYIMYVCTFISSNTHLACIKDMYAHMRQHNMYMYHQGTEGVHTSWITKCSAMAWLQLFHTWCVCQIHVHAQVKQI